MSLKWWCTCPMEREEVSAISLERRKQRLVRVMPHSHDLESRLCISLLPPMLPLLPGNWLQPKKKVG
ncbi:Uncharacterised protein [Segatella copri]|nr:Uncharacterised protein [Segatella copri]